MNEEFSGRGPQPRPQGFSLKKTGDESTGEQGVGALGWVWEMGEERKGDESSKRVESGRNRGKLPNTA